MSGTVPETLTWNATAPPVNDVLLGATIDTAHATRRQSSARMSEQTPCAQKELLEQSESPVHDRGLPRGPQEAMQTRAAPMAAAFGQWRMSPLDIGCD
jgi:hypothetical protein